MCSDQEPLPEAVRRRPPPGGLDRLTALLAELGRAAPEPVELAELLWLAARSTPGSDDADPAGGAAGHRARRTGGDPASPGSPGGHARSTARADGQAVRTALHLPSDDPAARLAAAAPVPAPSTPMLPRPLALQRALRPLKRRVPDPRSSLLDETATAHRLAEALRGPGQVQWLPVLRPSLERWLDLHLVLDCGPTMRLWRQLAHELRTLLQQTGAFRQVVLSGLGDDGRLTRRQVHGTRTAVLVLSDCMGPQWRAGPPGERWRRTLHALARRAPVAVVQPLPERLWRLGALPVLPGLLSAPEAGAPNAAYDFAPFAEDGPGAGELPVPVLEPGAGWIANWAHLVGSPSGGQVVGAALLVGSVGLTAGVGASAGPEPDELAAEELVLRFRSVASPEAFTLAGLTALTTPALPVMRLLQAAGFARPQPQHLAEVVVSGLLREREGHRDHFEFRPGVRELLLRTLPRSTTHRTVGLLARVGEQIAARAGRAPNEIAALAATEGPGVVVGAERQPFALISPAALRMLDGPSSPVVRSVPSPGTGRALALPDPERSRAVLLLAAPQSDAPLDLGGLVHRTDLNNLAGALLSRRLVGLDRERLWLGIHSLHDFRRALQAAAEEARDTLVVYVGGEVTSTRIGELAVKVPGQASLYWPDLLDLVGGSPAPNRLVVLDGWVAEGQEAPAEPAEAGSAVHQLIGVRPQTGRSLAGQLFRLLKDGEPGGRPELTVRHLMRSVREQAGPDQLVWLRMPGETFLFSRNPAASSAARTPVAPYFYLSHNHLGRPGAGAEAGRRELVEQLFADLSEVVMDLTDLPAPVPAGFLGGGGLPREEAAEALAGCRVFVPFYSPGYFREERCGREWAAFAHRAGGDGWSSGIVPALWEPVRPEELPEVAGQLRYIDNTVEEYATEGLLGLAAAPEQRARYELAVYRLAWRIVEVARTARIPVAPVPPAWESLPNAFAEGGPPGSRVSPPGPEGLDGPDSPMSPHPAG
ncbi:TIR-like protein FxsC [Kitasatospora sp. McL0602]|uniref:TIR-like protein FxsC n=1 Tax=Kitasatospora sp. McL0602 TaxID=3439530 RepID=UPI003F895A24